MKSDNDLQNSDNCVVLKTVSPQILDKLRESGLTVCTCCEFPDTAWLVFRPNMPTSDIHGEGYKEGSGRDLILYYQDPTIEVEKVDNMFMSLQDTYRSYEKELNALKAELKEEVNKLSNTQEQEYREKMAEFKAKYDKYTSELGELRSRFNSWKTSEMERISKLKIALPKNLLDIFEEIRRQGDSSSK